MTRPDSPRPPKAVHGPAVPDHREVRETEEPDAPDDRVIAAVFRAEVAALEALPEGDFADVAPDTREPIVARVVGRGHLGS